MSKSAKTRAKIDDMERRIAELERQGATEGKKSSQILSMKKQVAALRDEVAEEAGVWHRVELARHPQRPHTLDYAKLLFQDFQELHGDRKFADDPAIVCGMARFHGEPVMVVGHEKGHDTKERIHRNFGQPKPEGYRKALRAMRIAARAGRPIFCLVDTQGAYPGVDAEARGQAEAIAHNLREMARLPVPILVTITGEGGSGGALAIAIGDRVFMMENTFYSVISPEGCASIMWRDAAQKEQAAEALKLTPDDLQRMGLVDGIIPEPPGGAHLDYEAAVEELDRTLQAALKELRRRTPAELLEERYQKFRAMGQFYTD